MTIEELEEFKRPFEQLSPDSKDKVIKAMKEIVSNPQWSYDNQSQQ